MSSDHVDDVNQEISLKTWDVPRMNEGDRMTMSHRSLWHMCGEIPAPVGRAAKS